MTSIYSKSKTIEVFNLDFKEGDRVQHDDGTTGKVRSFFVAIDSTLQFDFITDDKDFKIDDVKTFKKIGGADD